MSGAAPDLTPALRRVLDALNAAGCKPRRSGRGWTARCPAHDDRTPSLGIDTGDGGRVLLICRAGCEVADVVSALKLEMRDLAGSGTERREGTRSSARRNPSWAPVVPVPGDAPPPPRLEGEVGRWEYRDARGRTLGYVVRVEPGADGRSKDYRPQTWCSAPSGRREWRVHSWPQPRPLYGLDRLAEQPEAPVVVAEGERSADAAERILGAVGVTSPGGSSAAAAAAWAPLAGRHVVVWPDADAPGRRYAAEVARLAREAGAASVRVVAVPEGWPAGWDLADAPPEGIGEDRLRKLAEEAEPDTVPPRRCFEALHEGAYRMTCPEAGAVLSLDFLRRDGAQLKGELLVRCDLAGARTYDGVLSIGDLNLSSARTRQSHAKYLEERAQAPDVDWVGLLEEFEQRVLAAEREGTPAVMLGDLPRPEPEDDLSIDGLALPRRHPAILFGDGGTAKSYLALYVAGTLAGRGLRVGFFDWELAAEDHRDRLERLFGERLPAIAYVRCLRPLHYEADRLRRTVREHAIDFAIFDSIAFACDGPPEAAEVAGRYFQSLRQLGPIGSLHLAHVTKAAEGADRRPFGSAFWHNGARSTWNVKLAEGNPGDSRITVGLYHRKANLGPLLPAVGFELGFEGGRTSVRPVDLLSAPPELSAALPLRQRMVAALGRGAMEMGALAEELGAQKDTVRRTVGRYKGMFRVLDGGLVELAR